MVDNCPTPLHRDNEGKGFETAFQEEKLDIAGIVIAQ